MSEITVEWEAELEALHGRIALCFSRSEPQKRALGYLKGLLSQCERKKGWQLAEQLGELNPGGVQRLLIQADWQSEQVMRVPRAYVVEQIGSQKRIDRRRDGLSQERRAVGGSSTAIQRHSR